jgi:hypothetical protein
MKKPTPRNPKSANTTLRIVYKSSAVTEFACNMTQGNDTPSEISKAFESFLAGKADKNVFKLKGVGASDVWITIDLSTVSSIIEIPFK